MTTPMPGWRYVSIPLGVATLAELQTKGFATVKVG